eukprot:Phypoly_transcript_13148.p1 GENE.Phypoly_transcript_13148~~Phypoly_transcript_13148.p1  ORF type:complete len:328 (+),score=43.16 Phypoly_transcript_13148:54-1037(+)
MTALHHACHIGDEAAVLQILEEGRVDINARREEDWATPLHEAARMGRGKVVELLLENGASICVRAKEGQTPYSVAAGNAKEIISRYEDELIKTGKIQEYLNFVASRPDAVRLMNKGADANLLSEENMLRLCAELIKNEKWVSLRLLVTNYKSAPKPKDSYIMAPLHALCRVYNPRTTPRDKLAARCESAELFLKKGYGVNDIFANHVTPQPFVKPQVRTFKTPLHTAIQLEFIPMVQLLVKYGANYSHYVITEDDKPIYKSVWQLCKGNKELLDALGGKWSPENHWRHPQSFRDVIKCLLLCNNRQACRLDNVTLYKIFMLISDWPA